MTAALLLFLVSAAFAWAKDPVTVKDNFNEYKDGPLAQVAKGRWVPLTRDWVVHNGMLEETEPRRLGTIAWFPGAAYRDVIVSVRFKILDEGNGVRAPGIVFGSPASDRYDYAHYDSKNHQVILVRAEPKKPWNELRRARGIEIAPGIWHTARVERRGAHIAAFLDGKRVAEADDTMHSAGVVGLRAGQGHILFDDFSVTGIPVKLKEAWKLMSASIPHDDLDCTRLTDAEHVIAARGEGYFPVMIRLHDGSLAAVIRGGAPHIGIGGRLDLIRSADGGKTWSKPTVVVDSRWDDRNPSFGQMPDGTLVCGYAEAHTYNAKGEWDPKAGEYILYYVTSNDDGKTWSHKQKLYTGPIRGGSPYGKITVTPNGTALMSLYGRANPDWKGTPEVPDGATQLVGIVRSRDNGRTWGDFSFVSTADHNETGLLALSDRHILAASRTYSDGSIDILESTDGGHTWSAPHRVTQASQHPGDLIRLSDGRILLAYGNRREPLGCGAMLSDDDGKTFDYAHRVMVGWTSVSGDCGYPSSAQLADGTIVTMYYSVGLTDRKGERFAIAVRYTENMLLP